MIPNSSATIARPSKAAPPKSKRARPWNGVRSRITQNDASPRISAIGARAQKMAGQPNVETSQPPNSGPTAIPTWPPIVMMPSARPRSLLGNASVTIAGPAAYTIVAPTAWRIRQPTSTSIDGARLSSSSASARAISPQFQIARRPIKSVRRPMPTSVLAVVRT